MKFFLFLMYSILPLLTVAQSAQHSPAPEVRLFQPLSLPGQQRPIVEPKPPILTQKDILYIILAVLLLAILASAVLICWKTSSIVLRVLIVFGALGTGVFVSFVLLTMIGLTATPDNSKTGIARRSIVEMGKSLGLSNETIATVFEDDECRIGLLLGEQVLVIADYGKNQGLLAPYASLDSVNSYEGSSRVLPPLPRHEANYWVVETESARNSSDTTHLQQIEWYFRGIRPNAIVVRYVQSDYFFPNVGSIASLCRRRMEESQ